MTSHALLPDEVLISAVQSLHQIQQEIAEETTEPWPAHSGTDYAGFPEPAGQLADDQLRLWFGPDEAPVLEFEPIDMSGVIDRD